MQEKKHLMPAGNPEKLMITTPLFYANGSPHIGPLAKPYGLQVGKLPLPDR